MTFPSDRIKAWAVTACMLAPCCAALVGCAAPAKVAELVVRGDDRLLRKRTKGTPADSPGHPAILLLAFDGVDRPLLYDMLRKGELPMLSELLAGHHGTFPHTFFDESFLSTLPSSTMAAWSTALTGVGPAHHGVTGNEFFIREERRMGAPAPASFSDAAPTLAIYTSGYLNALLKVPSVYERMREKEPNILIWVAVHHIFSGADRLLVAKPTVMAHAFEHLVEETSAKIVQKDKPSRSFYEKLDKDVVDVVTGALEKGPVPDVLTVYLSGTDLYAHVAEEGPDVARRAYLREVVEPAIADLTTHLRNRDALKDRYVVVTSDHGHTPVKYDEEHALSTKNDDDPPALAKKAGFRVRPFKLDVSDKEDFDAVFAYGGATAFIYVADRSTCPKAKDLCEWKRPPRYEEDVLPMAEAFFKNNEDGSLAPGMKGTLDLVLTRRPKPFAEVDAPFEVYVGAGKTVPVEDYLQKHPHPTYVAVQSRLRDLAVGPHGERAGDVLLLAHNGDRSAPEDRYYFASLYRSWHGSPSRQDSEIPLIVAHPGHSSTELRAHTEHVLGNAPYQQKITDLLLDLRAGK